jgi:hypothetical protein
MVALLEVGVTAEAGGALAGDGEHRGAQLDPGDGRVGRIAGQVAAGAYATSRTRPWARSPSHSRPPPNQVFSKKAICLS